jgi:hypothetical protein
MAAFLTTFVVLALMLLTIRGLLRRSRFAIGCAVGAVIAAAVWTTSRAVVSLEDIPLWLPPLPFALVAATLFCFGLLAWLWSED